MPPSGFNRDAINGALIFIKGCYDDLLKDMRSKKFKTYEQAIDYEITQIDKALTKLHIDADGNLTKQS